MCGIFGYVLDMKRAERALPLTKREKLVVTLADGNTRRGPHAWGAYTYENGAGVLTKGLGPMTAVPGLSTLALAETLVAHTRFATTGAVTVENAHPFQIGNVIGAHNGMIYNHAALSEKYKRTCEVDSMHIFHHMNEGRSFGELVGYGAVEYVRADANPAEVFLCRMQGGELAVYGLGPRSRPYGVIWSSSEEHLRTALKVAGVRGFPYVIRTGRVYSASPNGALYKTDTTYALSNVQHVTAADLARTRGEHATSAHRGPAWKTNTAGGPTPWNLRDVRPTHIQGVVSTETKPGVIVERDLVEEWDEHDALGEAEMDEAMAEFEAARRAGRLC